MKEWKLVDHPDIPGMMLVEGPAFRVVICTQASNIAFPEYRQIMADARLMVAAPEMYELLTKIRGHIDSTCRECESKAIVPEIDALLDKIKGGGE